MFGGSGISGGPAAATPPGAIVRAYPLDLPSEPAAEAPINDDGSFHIDVPALPGNELRLQVISTTSRSNPLDVLIGPDNTQPTLSVRPLVSCLLLTPALEIDVSTVHGVHVENRCTQPVRIEAPTVRRTVAGLQVGAGGSWPTVLAPLSSVDVSIVFHPSAAADEEIVFIEASSPQRDRRPITVRGSSP